MALVGNHLFSLRAAGNALAAVDKQGEIAEQSTVPTVEVAPAPQLTSHVVVAGETIDSIVTQYGTDAASLMSINSLSSSSLRTGQTLRVINVKGLVHKVQSGDTLWDIAQVYKVAVNVILTANPGLNTAAIQRGKELIIPGATKPVARTANVSRGSSRTSTASTASSSAGFSWPLRGVITSGFGYRSDGFHEAIDIGVNTGTTVRAAQRGKVVYAGWANSYGYLVEIDHGHGYQTRYAHNSKLLVHVGQTVAKGEAISRSGSTGNSTGPHLHFEVRLNGKVQNPLSLLP